MSIALFPTTPDDRAAVTALLKASYEILLPPHYPDAVLAAALPLITQANPTLLASGTYYCARAGSGEVVGCGGWTHARPGQGTTEAGVAHVRHFATHPDHTGRGIGRMLFERCLADADGITSMECYATLGAEPFYRKLGFETVKEIDIPLTANVTLPSLHMHKAL